MKYMITDDVRKAFLQYFVSSKHQLMPSSSLIPGNDPTLLFVNAGMVPFKDIFLGVDQVNFTRATSSQKCVRAGGKHNDLDQVGYTRRHHTFFEMLGNFSFGDYFKREAITLAWNFLTQVLKLPTERLWITVFDGDKESEDIWLNEIGADPLRFSRCGEKDNFWSMGEMGPCGPCTEIFFDHGPEVSGGPPGSKDEDGDRYVEIWNLVFMQYNRDMQGKLDPLPKPCVDTGMGLERIAAVMQGVHDNFEIDLFKHLLASVSDLVGCDDFTNKSMRVIADHIRSCAFLICDGVVPSNEGRGYVLRRIIRRAIRHGHKLGVKDVFFYKLVVGLIAVMGDAYPDLSKRKVLIESLLENEETLFIKTLDNGLKKFDYVVKDLSTNVIPGDSIFLLYDTYGFPPDLTADIARERNLTLDYEGFEQAMQRARSLSQAAHSFKLDEVKQLHIDHQTEFTGYERMQDEAIIKALISHDYRPIEELCEGEQGIVVLDRSPFYAESGGQVGDKGLIRCLDAEFAVHDTQAHGDSILHIGSVVKGKFKVNTVVDTEVDAKRQQTKCNHSATHLLHQALRSVLGEHVMQKGSLVDERHLRFDFSHSGALSREELDAVEIMVNTEIRNNVERVSQECSIEDAKSSGAMALFGEKYLPVVRVVTMGNFSKEICGGTHVSRTGDIGCFKIISEGTVAAGVRRIDALTGRVAMDFMREQIQYFNNICMLVKSSPMKVNQKVVAVLEENRDLTKDLNQLKLQVANAQGRSLIDKVVKIEGLNILAAEIKHVGRDELRQTLDNLKQKLTDAVIVLGTVDAGKVILVAGVSEAGLQHFTAGELLSSVATQVGGKAGGRADFAQGGGDLPEQLPSALISVTDWIRNKL